jgi:hypothetical protein
MADTVRYPSGVSVYEALRTHPGATPRLRGLGVTRDLLDYPLDEAARVLQIPVERLTAVLQDEPPGH